MKHAALLGAAVLSLGLGTAYAPATLAAPLTARECQSYPFVQSRGLVTHHQLQRELRELEAVGYDPHRISIYYPSDIQHAEVRLHAKYVRDCSGGTGMHDTTAGTQAAVMSRGF